MARFDRLATLYFFGPLGSGSQLRGIPILMYHDVSEAIEKKTHPYYRTGTAPAVFAGHMRYLHEQQYSSISLAEAVRRIKAPESLLERHKRPVVITFDDGYEGLYAHALPVLSEYGFTATVFLPTAYIGDSPRRFNAVNCLTWSQILEMSRAKVAFGSHTVTHPVLTTLTDKEIRNEVRGSKNVIEQKLGCSVSSFAYPYAFPEADHVFAKRLREILEEAGYENGVSTIIGTADRTSDRFFLERLPVNSCDDLRFFKAKLDGAYDWLHKLQYAAKLKLLRGLRPYSPSASERGRSLPSAL